MIRILPLLPLALLVACGTPKAPEAPQSTIRSAEATVTGKTYKVYWDEANKVEAWTQIDKRNKEAEVPKAIEAIRIATGCALSGTLFNIQNTLNRNGTPVAVVIRSIDCTK